MDNLIIDLRSNNYKKINSGSYSWVFIDKKNNEVIKVFIRPPVSQRAIKFSNSTIIYEDKDIPYQVCNNEIAAYEIIQKKNYSVKKIYTNFLRPISNISYN